jgi:hypothetical protein
MPRQIIDTQSSRPAYVRRRTIAWVVWLAVTILGAAGVWFVAAHHAMPVAR